MAERQGFRPRSRRPATEQRGSTVGHLNIARLRAAKVETEPFNYMIVPGFLSADSVRAINATYPRIEKGGSFPIDSLDESMIVREVIEELDGPEFEATVAEKFDVALDGRPKMYSLRGWTRAKDGQIHTDSKDKIITVLIYLNEDWKEEFGGHFELWDREMKGCRKKILPLFNRMAMFSTTSESYHCHPNPLTCPPDRTRKSLALYYYTNGRPEEEVIAGSEDHSTLFKYRKEDSNSHLKNSVKETIRLITPPILLKGFSKLKG